MHPRRIEETGEPPDPRYSYANERTFLAWNRTALALIAAGVAVVQLLELESTAARLVLGSSLIVVGAAIAALSYPRWLANELRMRNGQAPGYSLLLPLVAAVFGCIGAAAFAALLVEVL